jgi:hypothetical protein
MDMGTKCLCEGSELTHYRVVRAESLHQPAFRPTNALRVHRREQRGDEHLSAWRNQCQRPVRAISEVESVRIVPVKSGYRQMAAGFWIVTDNPVL